MSDIISYFMPYPDGNGVKASNCYLGLVVYLGLGLIFGILLSCYVRGQTRDVTMKSTNSQ